MTLTGGVFERFYTTPIEIGKISGGGGYSNPDGVYQKLCEIMADVQPCSGGLAAQEYGYSDDVEKEMFCNNNEHIKVGNIAIICGEKYDIKYVEVWESGATALLRKRR